MSPQSHRGRSGSGRKGHGRIEYTPRQPKPAEATPAEATPIEATSDEAEPVETPSTPSKAAGSRNVEAAAEARSRAEARRAARSAPRKKRQHGLTYRWLRAYAPLMLVLFVLLGGLWVYTTYLKPPTLGQQFSTIENKWSPLREQARADVAAAAAATPFDLAGYQAAVRTYSNQITGWTAAIMEVKDWGVAKDRVDTLKIASDQFVSLLKSVDSAKTAADVVALEDQITQYDEAYTANIVLIRQGLELPVASASPSPFAFPSVEPTASESPGASGSPAPSESPAAATPTPGPAETVSPSPEASATPASS